MLFILILYLFEAFFIFVKDKYNLRKGYFYYRNIVEQNLCSCINQKLAYPIFLFSKQSVI